MSLVVENIHLSPFLPDYLKTSLKESPSTLVNPSCVAAQQKIYTVNRND